MGKLNTNFGQLKSGALSNDFNEGPMVGSDGATETY